jgi:predicted anti-sigma-YlaC factor YlaD
MLNCKEITEIASDYLDNNLDWRKRFSVRFHLFICEHCNRFVKHLELTIGAMRKKPRQSATEEEIRHIISNIPRQDES